MRECPAYSIYTYIMHYALIIAHVLRYDSSAKHQIMHNCKLPFLPLLCTAYYSWLNEVYRSITTCFQKKTTKKKKKKKKTPVLWGGLILKGSTGMCNPQDPLFSSFFFLQIPTISNPSLAPETPLIFLLKQFCIFKLIFSDFSGLGANCSTTLLFSRLKF